MFLFDVPCAEPPAPSAPSASSTPSARCEAGWSLFENHCYKVTSGAEGTQSAMRQACSPGDLISIHSSDENNFMLDNIIDGNGDGDYWLGASHTLGATIGDTSSASFSWLDGTSWDFTSFATCGSSPPCEPNYAASSQPCVVVRWQASNSKHRGWMDAGCSASNKGICKVAAAPAPPPSASSDDNTSVDTPACSGKVFGHACVMSAAEIRSALSDAAELSKTSLHIPASATLALGGSQILVSKRELSLRSDGAGATLDAGSTSRVFEVWGDGATLHLTNIHIINGQATPGAAVLVTTGGSNDAGPNRHTLPLIPPPSVFPLGKETPVLSLYQHATYCHPATVLPLPTPTAPPRHRAASLPFSRPLWPT